MGMRIKSSIAIVSLCVLVPGSAAIQAATVTWVFGGTIIFLGLGGNDPVPGISLVDPVSGMVVYDTNTSPVDVQWATGYDLTSTPGLLAITVNGLTFSSDTNSSLFAYVLNDRAGYGDLISIEDTNWSEDHCYSIRIADEVAPFDLLSNESLPIYLDFSEAGELNPDGPGGNYGFIQSQGLTGENPLQTAHYSIDTFSMSVVPVPPALWLFGAGLMGLVNVAGHGTAA